MGTMYNNWGDPRRVAAAWRGGVSVGRSEPSEWTRGTLKYVNHATVPLGYPPTTAETVLDPIPEPTETRDDWQESKSVSDIYPVRRIEMTFPTPTSVKFALMLSHSLDVPWAAWEWPPTSPTDPPTSPVTEIFDVVGVPSGGISGELPGGVAYGTQYVLGRSDTVRINRTGGHHLHHIGGPYAGIYSSIGIENGFAYNISWPDTDCGIGPGAWSNWESSEAWFEVSENVKNANAWFALDLSPFVVSGYAPGLEVRIAYSAPGDGSYGNGALVGLLSNPSPGPSAGAFERGFSPPSTVRIHSSMLQGDQVYIVLSPAWQCTMLTEPGYLCDSSYANKWGYDELGTLDCFARGPRCTGMGSSGVLSLSGPASFTLRAVAYQDKEWWDGGAGVDNQPWSWGGQYRTTYPYQAGTLEVSWGGVELTRGVEFIEVDPAQGIFEVLGWHGEGQIAVTYWPPAGSLPTQPLPGEPGERNSNAVEAVIARAWSMIGVPYKLGAESLLQVDCSGLIYRIFTDAGYGWLIDSDRKLAAGYTRYFANQGYFTRNLAQARRGDLISYWNGTRVTHIGIYIGDGRVISAVVPQVTAHRTTGLLYSEFYGVLLVPYPAASTTQSNEAAIGEDDDEEEPQTPEADLPPQTPTTSEQRIYRPRVQSQLGWGTQWDGQNCNMAASAMALDRHTGGAYSDISGVPLSTPPNHRTYSGQTGPASLTRQGTSLADAQTAWDVGWEQTLLLPGPVTWEYFAARIAEGRGAIVHGLATVLPPELRKTDWTSAHALYVNEMLPDGSFWGVDPLYREPMIYPASVLRAYAISLHGYVNLVTCALTQRTA
jgi:cell wall-associated NlpC family hydrolase